MPFSSKLILTKLCAAELDKFPNNNENSRGCVIAIHDSVVFCLFPLFLSDVAMLSIYWEQIDIRMGRKLIRLYLSRISANITENGLNLEIFPCSVLHLFFFYHSLMFSLISLALSRSFLPLAFFTLPPTIWYVISFFLSNVTVSHLISIITDMTLVKMVSSIWLNWKPWWRNWVLPKHILG